MNILPPVDIEKYLSQLTKWNDFAKGKTPGKHHSSPIIAGLQSVILKPSPFVSLRSKTYWRSVAKPIDMQKRMDAYFSDAETVSHDRLIELSSQAVEFELGKVFTTKVSPLTLRAAFKLVPQDTSPGYPLNRMGYTEKRQCFSLLKRMNFMKKLFAKTHKVQTFPCLAGVRNQLCKIPDNKPRLTWVYPLEVAWIESLFALPLFERLKHCSLLAWDVNWFNGGSVELCARLPRRNAHYGFDISGFDASVLESRIRWAFSLLRKCLVLEKWQQNAWKFIVDYFVNTWAIMYDNAYLTHDGVPSGSFFTQVIDSLVNALAHFDAAAILARIRGFIPAKREVNRFDSLFTYWNFMGDDSLCELKFPLLYTDKELFEHLFLTRHNLRLHPDKGFFYPTEPESIDDEDDNFPPLDFLGKSIVSATDVETSTELVLAQVSQPDGIDREPGDALTRIIGVVWSKGTRFDQHVMLEREFKRIESTYDCKPLPPRKGEMRSFFLYVYKTPYPSLRFPSYQELVSRYRGENTSLHRNINKRHPERLSLTVSVPTALEE